MMRAIIWIMLAMLLTTACEPDDLNSSPAPPASANVPEAAPTIRSAATEVLPSRTATPMVTPLPTGPHAPQINNTVWLNIEPLTPDQLNGQVVLIDFWTFG